MGKVFIHIATPRLDRRSQPFAKAREQTPYEDLTRVEQLGFRAEAPEMMDIFDRTEQLVSVMSNPIYTRKVSLPRNG